MFKKVIAAASFLLLPWVSGAQNVDMFTGDFSYSVPLITLPAKNGPSIPFTLNYRAGIRPDQKASWVGLGWDMSTGEISRQVRGVPDEYNGDIKKVFNGSNSNEDLFYRVAPTVNGTVTTYHYRTDSIYNGNNVKGSFHKECIEDLVHTYPFFNSNAFRTYGNTITVGNHDNIYLSNPFFAAELTVAKNITGTDVTCEYNVFNLDKNEYSNQGVNNICGTVNEIAWFEFKDQSAHKGKSIVTLTNSNDYYNSLNTRPINGYSTSQLTNQIFGFVITDENGFKYYYTHPLFTVTETQVSVRIGREDLSEVTLVPFSTVDTQVPYIYSFKDRIKRQITTLQKPYIHSWKLTAITGPDYVDANNNKKTDEGDEGYWIGYDYYSIPNSGNDLPEYSQRSPEYGLDLSLNGNKISVLGSGIQNSKYLPDFVNRTGYYTNSTREYTFLEKVRSSTHTVFFVTQDRDDYLSRVHPTITDAKNIAGRKLNEALLFDNKVINSVGITLANCQQYNMYSLTSAELQTDYSLCPNYPSNKNTQVGYFNIQHNNEPSEYLQFGNITSSGNSGKLTLKKLIIRGNEYSNELPGYDFTYNSYNPDYDLWKKDMWGYYNSGSRGLTGAYNDIYLTTAAAENIDAWSLTKINTPSGEDIEIEYESDIYTNGKRYYLFTLKDGNNRLQTSPNSTCNGQGTYNMLAETNIDFTYSDISLEELVLGQGISNEAGKNKVGSHIFDLQILCAESDQNRQVRGGKLLYNMFELNTGFKEMRVKELLTPSPQFAYGNQFYYECKACMVEWPNITPPDNAYFENRLNLYLACINNGTCTLDNSDLIKGLREYVAWKSILNENQNPTALFSLNMQQSTGGGLRVKTITRTDNATGKKMYTDYEYTASPIENEPHPFVNLDEGYMVDNIGAEQVVVRYHGKGKPFSSDFGTYTSLHGYPTVGYSSVNAVQRDKELSNANVTTLGKTRYTFSLKPEVEVESQLVKENFTDRNCDATPMPEDFSSKKFRYFVVNYLNRRGAMLKKEVFDRENKLINEEQLGYYNENDRTHLSEFDLQTGMQTNHTNYLKHDQLFADIVGYDCGTWNVGNTNYLYDPIFPWIPNYNHNWHVANGKKDYPGFPGINPLREDLITETRTLTRPFVLRTSSSTTEGVKSSTEILRFDEKTGMPVLVKSYGSRGTTLSYSIPAYKYYTAMDENGSHQLAAMAFSGSYSGKLEMNPEVVDTDNGANYFVSGGFTMWSKEALQRRYNQSTGIYSNVTVQLPDFRPKKTWAWQGPSRPQINPLAGINVAAYTADQNWKNGGNATLYDTEWNAIESENTAGRKSCTKLGYNNRYAIAACADASYAELALSGAEEEVKTIGSTAWLDSEISIQNSTQRTDYLAHTGSYSVLMTSTFPKAYTYRAIIGTDLKANRYYRAMVWVHNSNKDVELYYNLNGNTTSAFKGEVKYVNTDMQVIAGSWHLLTIEFVLSGVQVDNWYGGFVEIGVRSTQTNQAAYADDFRFQPADVTIGSKVYEPLRGLTLAELDNNNFAVKYVYDNSGRLVETYTEEEKKGSYAGGFRLVKKTTYNTSKKP